MVSLDLIVAEVLGPEGLHRGELSIADGLIANGRVGRSVDLSGFLVLPGIVDLHGDAFERHMAPRRGAMKQIDEGLIAAEAELAANGITTAVLAQFVSWEGGLRGPEFAGKVFGAIRDTGPTLPTDLRGQLRFEVNLLDLYDGLPDQMTEWGADYIVFNDHLPHDRLAAGRMPKRLTGQALKAGRSPESHLKLMHDLHARRSEVPMALDRLCAILAERGITMGSHDDRDADQRAAWRARGVGIAEFPETLEAAEAGHAGGDAVLMGAPNVVRGGSHNGNLSALDVVMMGQCDALASDYHYPSPRRAALMLAESGAVDFATAWGLVSSGPAAVLGLTDRGILKPGMRADITVLDARTKRVAATIAGGKVTCMAGEVGARFLR